MMDSINLVTVAVTTDASGDFSATLNAAPGRFLQMQYTPDGSSPLDTGADIDLAGTTSGFVYLNHDNIGTTAYAKSIRYPVSALDGSASLYAGAGEPVEDYGYVGGESLTFTVASGGNAKAGTFYFWFG